MMHFQHDGWPKLEEHLEENLELTSGDHKMMGEASRTVDTSAI